jgi:Mn-dependent DtxR family transcriptional regulator
MILLNVGKETKKDDLNERLPFDAHSIRNKLTELKTKGYIEYNEDKKAWSRTF